MPELPEVETIRQDLRRKILGTTITRVTVVKAKAVKSPGFDFIETVTGEVIEEIERVGKLMMFRLKKHKLYMLIHLKMTGQLIHIRNGEIVAGGHSFPALNTVLPDKHTQVYFNLSDGSVLYFNDMRRFGYIKLVTETEKRAVVETYGIEPLTSNFTWENFQALFANKKTNLKALLLNQAHISGIGNIYADEICHEAGVLPWRRVNTISTSEMKKLFIACTKVIAKAVKYRGTTFNNYIDSEGNTGNFVKHLKVYERNEERCKTCKKDTILKKRVAGRGTHYCATCQK